MLVPQWVTHRRSKTERLKRLGRRVVRRQVPMFDDRLESDMLVLKNAQIRQAQPEIDFDLSAVNEFDGLIGCCVFDVKSGAVIREVGEFDFPTAAIMNADVIRIKLRAIDRLGLDDEIENIAISLGKQYHLMRPLRNAGFCFYLVLDRARSNLSLALKALRNIEPLHSGTARG